MKPNILYRIHLRMMSSNKNGENSSALSDLNKMSKGTAFKGDIVSDGDFRIDGRFEGTITTSGRIVIGVDGRLDGTVQCLSIDVEGTLNGTVNASEVLSVKKTGRVSGQVTTGKLSVELGAVFDVESCRMRKEGE